MPYNPNKELLRLAEQNPRLLFYPSSGINRQRFFDEDYDVFVFVDNAYILQTVACKLLQICDFRTPMKLRLLVFFSFLESQ